MLRRNRELMLEFTLCAILTLTGFSVALGMSWDLALVVLALGLGFSGIVVGFSCWRYGRLKRLSGDLEQLLHGGSPLPIEHYTEGELSVLASQIQKMTLRLLENASVLEKDKKQLANSLADISHQLRTPLTAMHLTAAMLSASDLTPERRQELTVELKHLLRRTQWLVESLLKLSRLDAGVVSFVRESVEVRELVHRAALPLSIPMELREQRLITHCGEITMDCDPVWTAEALGNVLKNAMEHTPSGGTITIRAEQTPIYTRITVEDTGPGFSNEDIPHLFERFYQGKGNSGAGYGIGLALSRRIIASQNGTIQAANGDKGAVFTIKFYRQTI